MAKISDMVQYLHEDGGQPVAAVITEIHQDGSVNLMIFGTDWTDSRFNKEIGTDPGNWRVSE